MAAYEMTCSCGHEIKMDATNRDEAISKIQAMMDKGAITSHFREKHPGDEVPPVAAVHSMIAEKTVAA